MNDKEKLEIWKRKKVEIESKLQKLSNEKNILANLLNEVKTYQNVKLNNSLKGLDLFEEILHLKDWIEFDGKEISRYKYKINALEIEVSQQEILDKEFEDLDKEAKEIEEKEKEVEQKELHDVHVEIPTPEEIEKDFQKGLTKSVEKESELDLTILEDKNVELEKTDYMIAGRQPAKDNEKEVIAITRLFDENLEIKAVRAQIKELFKDKKDIIRQSRFKEKLGAIKQPISNIFGSVKTSVNNGFESLKSIDNKYVIYTVPIILLLLITGILFVSQPEITGYVTLTQEKTYTDNLDLIVNESGNYTWTIDQEADIKSILANGKVKGNGTVKIYIEKNGERYLIYDNKEENR